MQSEPLFEQSQAYPSNHAATLVDLGDGRLLAAWFGGTHEGHPDVSIWLARYDGRRWQAPMLAARAPGVPLWNPVLFRRQDGTIWLFYKAGPNVPAWSGLYIRSQDGGETWSAPVLLPAGLIGPAKNKPVTLSNGAILCPTSAETWQTWAAWVEISSDGGATWTRHGPITAPGDGGAASGSQVSATWDAQSKQLLLPDGFRGVIQPSAWEYAPGHVKMLLRSTPAVGFVCAATSDDYGLTWSQAQATAIPNPNSGLDAVRLTDGRLILACNPTTTGRSPLSLLLSADNGETWPWRKDLETGAGEYSYPSIIQADDGRVHVVYTHRRVQIRHAVLNADELGKAEATWSPNE